MTAETPIQKAVKLIKWVRGLCEDPRNEMDDIFFILDKLATDIAEFEKADEEPEEVPVLIGNGHECGCMGLPIEPNCCSDECWQKLGFEKVAEQIKKDTPEK